MLRFACVAALLLLGACDPPVEEDLSNGANAARSSPAALSKPADSRDDIIEQLKAENEALKARAGVQPKHSPPKVMDDVVPETSEAPLPRAAQYPGNCYKDYCPCEAPQEGMDTLLCDQLEEGLDVPIEMMIGGRGMREARRQMRELD